MDFDRSIRILNKLLSKKHPEFFNSTWILKHSPACYYFIRKNVRTEVGTIDWDKVTYALEWKYQRRWSPGKKRISRIPYRDSSEVNLVLRKYREKLYVFIAPTDLADRRARDIISVRLVRLAQHGNLSAKRKFIKLVRYTVDGWLDKYYYLSRWKGYDEGIRKQIEGCIRRYRYTGSFLNYVFRTLEYAGRGIRPFYAYSLDEPVTAGTDKCKMENVVQDPETQEIGFYSVTSPTFHFEPRESLDISGLSDSFSQK